MAMLKERRAVIVQRMTTRNGCTSCLHLIALIAIYTERLPAHPQHGMVISCSVRAAI